MKKALEITEQNFDEIVPKGIVVLDFWASWCGPCRAFAPIFEAAAERHSDVKFGKVDTEAQPALAASFEIRAIPTLAILREGVLLGVHPGAVPGEAIDQILEKVRALDMDEILKEVEKRKEPSDEQRREQR